MSWLGFMARRCADGLSSAAPMEPKASPPKASIPREKTIVYLRPTKIPASFWEDVVHYDAWGAPYIRGYGNRKCDHEGPATELFKDGSTSATWLSGTKWKHKSGPPISFGKAPADPFSEARGEQP